MKNTRDKQFQMKTPLEKIKLMLFLMKHFQKFEISLKVGQYRSQLMKLQMSMVAIYQFCNRKIEFRSFQTISYKLWKTKQVQSLNNLQVFLITRWICYGHKA